VGGGGVGFGEVGLVFLSLTKEVSLLAKEDGKKGSVLTQRA